MTLSRESREELLALVQSESLRKDMRELARIRRECVSQNDILDMDAWIDFLTQYNEFVNHARKPFRPMIEREMLL